MATQAQVDANQANSQKSTGPKTDEGKAKSSRKRLSHGFASSTRFVLGEDPAEFNLLLDDLISEHHPATPTEQILVEQMAHHHWISLRATRLLNSEVAFYLKSGCTPVLELGLFMRYQAAAERSFYKAHTALLKAQKQRHDSQIGFESQKPEMAPEAPPKSEPKTPEPPPATEKIPFPAPAEPGTGHRGGTCLDYERHARRIAGARPLKVREKLSNAESTGCFGAEVRLAARLRQLLPGVSQLE